jgi:ABC-2 type transport system ATP-binding protein
MTFSVGGKNMMSVANAIELKQLEKIFSNGSAPVHAVNKLTLQIRKGELYGLLGPNGAGKSTTINIMCGLLPPSSGTAVIGGYDVVKSTPQVKKIIGVCPQEPSLFPYLTGRQNIELFGNLHSVGRGILRERTAELLDRLNLTHDANRQIKQYSGGMVRRINTAVALIGDPEIVFLDEPTVAMDPQSRHAVWDFILDLKTKGKTVILTTHYIEEAEALCDRIGIIDHGTLIAEDTPAALKQQYTAKSLEDVFIQITGRKIREGN